MEQNTKGQNQWLVFIGFILLLTGIYGIARTTINLIAFDKYPQEGVYPPLPFLSQSASVYPGPYSYQREADCLANFVYYPYPYYKPDGTPRPATKEEKEQQEQQKQQLEIQKQNCLDGIAESRDKAKINDLSQSLLLLFIGAGVLASKKILKRG